MPLPSEISVKKVVHVLLQTQRLGLAMLAFFCATPIGSAVAGPVFEKVGYSWTFGIGAACNMIAVLYAVVFIQETVKLSIMTKFGCHGPSKP